MKKLNKYILVLLALTVIVPACKDEDLVIVPEWGTAVHGETLFSAGSQTNFISAQDDVLSFDIYWNSVDSKNTVSKIEVFAYFSEPYVDIEGNPKTATYGGDEGFSLLTLEGAEVPANRETTTFTISQDDYYALFSTSSFDYDEDGVATPVWDNPDKPDRNTTTKKFVPGDTFEIRWEFTTSDGRVFDSWSPSVCNEFPGANCSVSWALVCSQAISLTNIPGDYTIEFTDTYGDGWNGAGIEVLLNGALRATGAGTVYTLAAGASGTTVVTVPEGTTELRFAFVSGDWDSECIFKITSPRGNVIAAGGPSPEEDYITFDLCNGE